MSISGPELQQLMLESAADAVKFAQEEFSVPLDQSPESIAAVDDLILAVRERYQNDVHDSKVIFTLCNLFGAYIGEVFRTRYGGTWVYDDGDKDAPAVFLAIGEYTFAFAGIVYQRLVNDQTLSTRLYYEEAVKNAAQAH
ncbi:MAG: hypothetical protein JJU10_08060 [Idiomarina sp.]|nr:hypothetical protein [Idiomarina sp.]